MMDAEVEQIGNFGDVLRLGSPVGADRGKILAPQDHHRIVFEHLIHVRDVVLAGYRELAAATFDVRQDPALMRPLEQRVKIGNPAKLHALGWQLEYTLRDTLRSILDYWRARPS